MRVACRMALVLLGCVLARSAAEHWAGSDELRSHYAASALGPHGLTGVAVAQSVAAVGLLWPRTQPVAGVVLAVVMLVAAGTHVRADGVDRGVWLPLAVGAWALLPALLLGRRTARCTGPGGVSDFSPRCDRLRGSPAVPVSRVV